MIKSLLQIIDANLNRAREGLRVCEDIFRFVVADRNISAELKGIRHRVTRVLLLSKRLSFIKLLETRNTKNDVLKSVDITNVIKSRDTDVFKICMANLQRVKESLRVLEECTKTVDKNLGRRYRRLRFQVYDLEKKAVKKIRDLSDNG